MVIEGRDKGVYILLHARQRRVGREEGLRVSLMSARLDREGRREPWPCSRTTRQCSIAPIFWSLKHSRVLTSRRAKAAGEGSSLWTW